MLYFKLKLNLTYEDIRIRYLSFGNVAELKALSSLSKPRYLTYRTCQDDIHALGVCTYIILISRSVAAGERFIIPSESLLVYPTLSRS